MNEKKTLTISIAAYNVEKYLEEALESLLEESILEELEILIVNDGSSDNTAEIGRKYQEKYPEAIRLIDKENGGWGSTVNTGIREAGGRYFRQLDGDDLYSRENLKGYIEFLRNANADIVISPYIAFQEGSNEMVKRMGYSFEKTEGSLRDIGNEYNLAMHSAAVKTEVLKRADFTLTEHCFYTDAEYMVQAAREARTYALYDRCIYCYRVGEQGQSMSIEGAVKHHEEHLQVLEKILEIYKKVKLEENVELIKKRIEIMIRTQYDFYWLLPKNADGKVRIKKFDRELFQIDKEIYKSAASKKIKLARFLHFENYRSMHRFITKNYTEIS